MKISDTVVGAGFVAAGALIIAGTLNYPSLDGGHPGPSLFPRLVGGLMVVFGGLVGVEGLRTRDATEDVVWLRLYRNPAFINALFVLGSVAAYIAAVERVGFLLMSTLILAVLMWRLRVRLLTGLAVAVVFSNCVYFLFAKVLRVPLPGGLVWW
jgi:putative tricarboxylic transport membrane protein